MAFEMLRTVQTAKIIYIMGGPGAGKGTQCALLARDVNLVHVSIGDLLRAEQHQPQSARAEAIRAHYNDGEHLSDHVYVDVLREHLSLQVQNGKKNFIVDGFPRNIFQAGCFEGRIDVTVLAVLFLHCPEHVMMTRVLNRSHTSGRVDDSETAFKRRYDRFMAGAEAVMDFYRGAGMLFEFNSNRPVEEVYSAVRSLIEAILSPFEDDPSANAADLHSMPID